jgi:hypothetical protein
MFWHNYILQLNLLQKIISVAFFIRAELDTMAQSFNVIHAIERFPFDLQGAQLRKHIDATLGSGNLREAVRLPPGEDINEWLAVNSNVLPFHFPP